MKLSTYANLLTFVLGNQRGKSHHGGLAKRSHREGSHTSMSAPQNAPPLGAQDNVLLFLGHSADEDGGRALNKAPETLL